MIDKAIAKDTRKWVKGYAVNIRTSHVDKDKCLTFLIEENANCSDFFNNLMAVAISVYPETLCKGTGLLDENGNEIFEGDLLECNYPYPYRETAVVKYGEYMTMRDYEPDKKHIGFYVELEDVEAECTECYGLPDFMKFGTCRIVGNIHESTYLCRKRSVLIHE